MLGFMDFQTPRTGNSIKNRVSDVGGRSPLLIFTGGGASHIGTQIGSALLSLTLAGVSPALEGTKFHVSVVM